MQYFSIMFSYIFCLDASAITDAQLCTLIQPPSLLVRSLWIPNLLLLFLFHFKFSMSSSFSPFRHVSGPKLCCFGCLLARVSASLPTIQHLMATLCYVLAKGGKGHPPTHRLLYCSSRPRAIAVSGRRRRRRHMGPLQNCTCMPRHCVVVYTILGTYVC